MEPLRATDPRQLGAYRLHARLGSGGMGQVYLGFSQAGRAAAVKVVHPELARDEGFRSRFRHEVAAARRVGGGCTAPVLDAGVDDDPPWVATAFVPGPSLADVVEATAPLAEASVWRLAGGLVEALATIHACGIVHRDLKPANILMAADGPRVIDFGISRARESTTVTASGQVIGTPGFMSPEQAEGLPVGPPSDVFSLGAVLAFAATGREPFGEGLPAAIMYRLVHREPDLADLPAPLSDLVLGCLAKRPDDRPTLSRLMEIISGRLAAQPGASPTSFWPGTVAEHIRAYQRVLSAQARVATPTDGDRRASPPSGVDPRFAATSTSAPPRLPGAEPGGPGGSTGPRRPEVAPSLYGRPGTGLTRRRLLLGLAGISVIGTGVIWGLGEAAKGSRGSGGSGGSGAQGPPSFPRSATVSWTFHAQDWVKSAAADGGVVYVAGLPPDFGTPGGGVYALHASDGSRRWRSAVGPYSVSQALYPVVGPVVAGVCYVIAGNDEQRVYALHAGDGTQKWTYAISNDLENLPEYTVLPQYTAPAVGDGVVCFGAENNSVYALHASNGAEFWNYPSSITARPVAVADGMVFVWEGNDPDAIGNAVRALRASDGTSKWRTVTGLPAWGALPAPVVADGVVYVTDAAGYVSALRASDGSRRWRSVPGSPCVVSGGVVYGTDRASVFALHVRDGSRIWQYASTELGPPTAGPPIAVADGVVYCTAKFGVFALRAGNGHPIWGFSKEPPASGPVQAGSVICVGGDDGTLYALRA
jgi:outer membrane protein assembly factor BamB